MKLSKEFKIGAVVVCAIAAFIWGVSFLRGSNLFSGKEVLYAVYPQIDGLTPANPVLVNGFKVGQIQHISLIQKDGKNLVLVKLLITEDVVIPKRSTARAVSADLLGGRAIDLIFSKEKEYVKSGDTLRTESERGLKESFNKQIAPLQAKAESLLGQIDSLTKVFNAMLNIRTRENIDKSFESVRRAILSLERTAYKFDDLMTTEKPKISSVFTNLNGITTNLNKNEEKINNILNNFSNLSDSLAKSQLKSAITNADNTMRELNTIMARINSGEGTLGKLAKNDSLYDNLNRSAASLDKLLQDLKENPKSYVHFSIFGKKGKKKS